MQSVKDRVRFLAVVAIALIFFGAVQSVHAATITTLYSTGVDASGNPLADGAIDSHYTVNGGSAYTIGNPGSVGWVGNTATSSWISNVPNTDGGSGPFTYHTTFDLTGLNPNTAQITGQLSADDQATIYLNGVDVFDGLPTGSSPWSQLESFSISSGFVAGTNTLDIDVPNNIQTPDDGPTGLQVNLSGTASAPEPASLFLLGVGFGALSFLRRRA